MKIGLEACLSVRKVEWNFAQNLRDFLIFQEEDLNDSTINLYLAFGDCCTYVS